MSLSKKILIVILWAILLVAIVNIVAFYIFYNNFFKIYLSEKNNIKKTVTLEYINKIIEKQTADEIDNIFSDAEMEFFELLKDNNYKIPLDKEKNRNIIINYLVNSWVSPKYIAEFIPKDNLSEILKDIKDKNSPEYHFLTNITKAILITNLIVLFILSIFILYFLKRTIWPIKLVANKIKKLKPWTQNDIVNYNKKDEIWLLIDSINWLNKKLIIQKNIRSRLLADISHELKTPITSIQCYLEWIADWIITLDKTNLKAITEEMTRLISLVNRIMNYEKFENQKLEAEKKQENIFEITKQVVETHKKNLKQNNQIIKIIWDSNLKISLDKNLFKQIVHNMIWNFLKYAWKNTTLTINITKKYIDFKDNWAWVNKNEIPYLTEKFYQANKEKSGDAQKRWIWVWLSLVVKIIEVHKWSYEINSEKNKWFSFKIFF